MGPANDLIVRLYTLPSVEPLIGKLETKGILIRRPRDYEKSQLLQWIEKNFNRGFRDECDMTFSHPIRTFVAIKEQRLIGFCSYEATHRNFAGPLGVLEEFRGQGIGMALLQRCLQGMAEMGYAYAILGGVADYAPLCRKLLGATDIEGSMPGIYTEPLVD